jgi:hypothetical protein
VTAIVAATLAANLGLIALDVAAPAPASAGERGSPHAEALPGPA